MFKSGNPLLNHKFYTDRRNSGQKYHKTFKYDQDDDSMLLVRCVFHQVLPSLLGGIQDRGHVDRSLLRRQEHPHSEPGAWGLY